MTITPSDGLAISFDAADLPGLQQVLLRAMNTWEPKDIPKWAWTLDAAVVAKLNDLKEKRSGTANAGT